MEMIRRIFALCALFLVSVSSSAEIFFAGPDNYDAMIDQLTPGDTLQLSPGDYMDGLNIRDMAGSQELPITISGPEGEHSAVFHGRACCNTVQIENSSHMVFKWLKLDGSNVAGIDGVNSRGITHHITIEHLLIVGHGNDQSDVGISTKGSAWDWVVRKNTLLEAGTGMYFGNSDGNFPFVRGLIEYNFVADSIGYNIQVKHQNPRPLDIGLPANGSSTIIRHNVFVKENNYSTGGMARPNLLVGHFPLSGDGSNDNYEIYGNFFYENPSEALFQGEGNINFHNNVLLNDSGDAIQIVPHNDRPRRIVVAFNTVIATGRGINISGAQAEFSQVAAGNLVLAGQGISSPVQRDNIEDAYESAGAYLQAPFLPLGSKSLFPLPGKATGQDVSLNGIEQTLDIKLDFNGIERQLAFRGAYAGEGSNPGWVLARGEKAAVGRSDPQAAVVLTVDRQSVPVTESVLIDWSSTNVESCIASGSWSGDKPPSGSESVVVTVEGNNQFVLICSGQFGSETATITVTGEPVAAPPPPIINDDPAAQSGGGAFASWSLFLLASASIWRFISARFIHQFRLRQPCPK